MQIIQNTHVNQRLEVDFSLIASASDSTPIELIHRIAHFDSQVILSNTDINHSFLTVLLRFLFHGECNNNKNLSWFQLA